MPWRRSPDPTASSDRPTEAPCATSGLRRTIASSALEPRSPHAGGPILPRRRTADLLVRELGDELVVYDRRSHRAHRLNRVAAAIWTACDGHTDSAEMARELSRASGIRVADRVVDRCLRRLDRAALLDHEAAPERVPDRITRRRMLSRLAGIGAAAAVAPLVTSILVPHPLVAQSLLEVCETSPPPGSTECFCTGCGGPPDSSLCTTAGQRAVVFANGVCIPATDPSCGGRPCTSRIAYVCRRPGIWGRDRANDDRRCATV